MGEYDQMNLHPEAIKIRNDINRVFSSFQEISLCGLTEKFVNYLKTLGIEIEFITVYEYITKTTLPAWLLPYLCNFLSQEPYINSPFVWEFAKKYAKPFDSSSEKIRLKIEEKKKLLIEEADKFRQYL